MTRIGRIVLLSLFMLAAVVITITACGGGLQNGGGIGAARAFIFNSNPAGFHITHGFGATRASASGIFVVNAQATTPGGGNFAGFCSTVNPSTGRAATVLYGLGIWSSGDCSSAGASDSDVGVTISQPGQIGNVSVDAVGTGTVADDGKVGLASAASGQIEVTVIHADGTRAVAPITCTLGVSNNAKVHCDDKTQTSHRTSVVAGDQVIAKFWYSAGDSYRAIRVNLEYATPTF